MKFICLFRTSRHFNMMKMMKTLPRGLPRIPVRRQPTAGKTTVQARSQARCRGIGFLASATMLCLGLLMAPAMPAAQNPFDPVAEQSYAGRFAGSGGDPAPEA